MGTKVLHYDDLTGRDLDGSEFVTAKMMLVITDTHADGKENETTIEGDIWELGEFTSQSLIYLAKGDLPEFIRRMRPLVKIQTEDSEAMRAWLREHHPELKVGEKGRISEDHQAVYRREVSQKVATGDSKS